MPQKGYRQTEEQKKKIGLANKGKEKPPVSESTRMKHKLAMQSFKGIPRSDEVKRKISEAKKGKHYQKLSESKTGAKHHFYGKKFTDEHRKKISNGTMGHEYYKMSKEGRASYIEKMLLHKRIGPENNMRKGGITPENHKIRWGAEMKYWRKVCFTRDNFVCQACLVSGGVLNVHHINNFADYPELRTEINNGITLCKKCHTKFHHIYGNKNNTQTQIHEFIYHIMK